MTAPPEMIRVTSPRVRCDGAGEIAPALGHPRVWMQIDEAGYVDCGYCDRRFVLVGGAVDRDDAGTNPTAPGSDPIGRAAGAGAATGHDRGAAAG